MLEALSSGLATIASVVPGFLEVLESEGEGQGMRGITVANDVETVSEAILELPSDKGGPATYAHGLASGVRKTLFQLDNDRSILRNLQTASCRSAGDHQERI